jgi:hypothetical protein
VTKGFGVQGRAIIIHSLAHARAALAAAEELRTPVTLLSAPGAGGSVGPLWFREVVALAAADHPKAAVTAVLDCADKPGPVMAAFHHGIKAVRFTGRRRVAEKLAEIAEQSGARLITGRIRALDLLDEAAPEAACRAYLARGRAARGRAGMRQPEVDPKST